jgi:hypothetical protein
LFLNAPVLGYDTTLIAGLIATVLGYAAEVGFTITFEVKGCITFGVCFSG